MKSDKNSLQAKLTKDREKKKASSRVSDAAAASGAKQQDVSLWDPDSGTAASPTKAARDSKAGKNKDEIHGIKIGATFKKTFEGHGTFTGTVVEYLKEKKYFSVIYEDGDTEELKTDDLRALMGMGPRKRKPKA
jgi:predicted flap endonuclease-1-like 5' DNA nuclease